MLPRLMRTLSHAPWMAHPRCRAAQPRSLAALALDRSNANAASDLGCAALHLGCAIQGAWLNVLINLGSIRDVAFAAQYRTRGQILLDEALPLSRRIYGRILEMVE